LGAFVRDERKRQGLTQVRLAGLCGVSARLLGELETGRESVGFSRILRICMRLGVDLMAVRRGMPSGTEPEKGSSGAAPKRLAEGRSAAGRRRRGTPVYVGDCLFTNLRGKPRKGQ